MSAWNNYRDFPKPANMTNREWRALTNEQRVALAEKQESDRRDAARDFDTHMRYEKLATPELTWLRDRLLELLP